MKWKAFARTLLPLATETELEPMLAQEKRPRPSLPEKQLPMISIIIPAHNEEAYLGQTLEAVQLLTYPRYEIVVVANGCSDQTAVIAQNHCDQLVVLEQSGISNARNVGATVSRGDVLLFLDADTLLTPDALEVIAHEFTRAYAAGTLKGKPDSPRLAFRLLYGFKNLMHSCALHKGSIGVILCWKDYFDAAGGFENNLNVMENSRFIRKLQSMGKYRCIRKATAVTSMRRYEKTGFWRTSLLWIKLWFQSHWLDLRNKPYAPVR